MLQWLVDLFRRLTAWLARVFGVSGPTHMQQYVVKEIPPLGGTASWARDINNSGIVVGSAQTAAGTTHGYSWDAGASFDLGAFPGPNQSNAFAINRNGHIGGQSQVAPAGVDTHAYVVPANTMIVPAHDIGTLGGGSSCVLDLSVDHIAVGWADDGNGLLHAFFHMISGPMVDITPGHPGLSQAEAIDSADRVVGWIAAPPISAFRWRPSSGLNLIMPPGATSSRAFGIQYSGEAVVGEADFGGGAQAVMWDGNNVVTQLGTLGGVTSAAHDINGAGEIVGTSTDAGGASRAFITTKAGPMVDLNQLIAPGSGWLLTEANAINEQGQIVGNGTYNGQQRGFLLT